MKSWTWKTYTISIFRDASAEDEKVDQPLNSAENLETANKWPVSEKDNDINTLIWKQILGQTAHSNFNTLHDQCNGKMPLDIFEMLFNQELRIHLVHETLQHAKVSHMIHHSLFMKMNYENTLMFYYFLGIIFYLNNIFTGSR